MLNHRNCELASTALSKLVIRPYTRAVKALVQHQCLLSYHVLLSIRIRCILVAYFLSYDSIWVQDMSYVNGVATAHAYA